MSKFATYVADEVKCIMGGHIIGGFPSGSRISIEQPTDEWQEEQGTDLVSRTYTGTDLYIVTITLQQTSDSNDKLSFFSNQDKNNKLGTKEFSIIDFLGNTKFFSPNSYIRKKPTQGFSDTVSNREWVIVCPDVTDPTVGGNNPI